MLVEMAAWCRRPSAICCHVLEAPPPHDGLEAEKHRHRHRHNLASSIGNGLRVLATPELQRGGAGAHPGCLAVAAASAPPPAAQNFLAKASGWVHWQLFEMQQ